MSQSDKQSTPVLALAALGVVYGDVGTSPLYAFKTAFTDVPGLDPSPANVLGILSLIFWALIVVISIKYISYVMRADHRGEGGVLALMTLVAPRGSETRGWGGGSSRWGYSPRRSCTAMA